jgi:hypothetical protein
MNILLIGHCAIDAYFLAPGRTEERFGGVVNGVLALARRLEPKDRVIPVCGVGAADHERLLSVLGEIPGVDSAGIFKTAEPTNRVEYYPAGTDAVAACAKSIALPIPFERIKPFLNTGGVLVNMASGNDLALETLDQIRIAVRDDEIPLHLDLHNLTTGVNERHERVRRPVEQWRRWAFMTDILQCNQEELAGLTVEAMKEEQTVGHLFTLGVKGVMVTRGAGGVSLYRSENKTVLHRSYPAMNGTRPRISVGAGDAFGAAAFYRYLKTRNLEEAVTDGIEAASAFLRARGEA